jgi:hypothetical protein
MTAMACGYSVQVPPPYPAPSQRPTSAPVKRRTIVFGLVTLSSGLPGSLWRGPPAAPCETVVRHPVQGPPGPCRRSPYAAALGLAGAALAGTGGPDYSFLCKMAHRISAASGLSAKAADEMRVVSATWPGLSSERRDLPRNDPHEATVFSSGARRPPHGLPPRAVLLAWPLGASRVPGGPAWPGESAASRDPFPRSSPLKPSRKAFRPRRKLSIEGSAGEVAIELAPSRCGSSVSGLRGAGSISDQVTSLSLSCHEIE